MFSTTDQQDQREAIATLFASIEDAFRDNNAYLRTLLAKSVQTLDTIVNEIVVTTFLTVNKTIVIPPQTKQSELITTVLYNIRTLHLVTAPKWQKCYLQLGTVTLSPFALSSGGGTTHPYGGVINLNPGLILQSNSVRKLVLKTLGTFAATGAVVSVALLGTVIPATLGEVLY